MRMKTILEILAHFFYLGCISFGGPAAHIGYFQRHFVVERQWLGAEDYARFLALTQVLPGPGSSQMGFIIGLERGGILGAFAAFIGFTLPSFLLMVGLFQLQSFTAHSVWMEGAILGLKLLAVVVVIDAVLQMARAFCQTVWLRAAALMTCVILLLIPSLSIQILLLLMFAAIGAGCAKPVSAPTPKRQANRLDLIWLALFAALFAAASLVVLDNPWWQMGAQFYQAGSLVFGGGHVVLPLLQQAIEMDTETFLTGYAAAQGVPGPMFTLATYLGSSLSPEQPWWGALIATIAIFMPGFLLVLGVRSHWQAWSSSARFLGAVAAVNAAVVGLLLATFFATLVPIALEHSGYLALVLVGLFALQQLKIRIINLVLAFVSAGILFKVATML